VGQDVSSVGVPVEKVVWFEGGNLGRGFGHAVGGGESDTVRSGTIEQV
jgi:hypothetical protein